MNGNQNLDREKLQAELQKRELDIRQKEIDLKEKELGRSGWAPGKVALVTIVGTILAASVAALAQTLVAFYTNSAQLEIEHNWRLSTSTNRLKRSRTSSFWWIPN